MAAYYQIRRMFSVPNKTVIRYNMASSSVRYSSGSGGDDGKKDTPCLPPSGSNIPNAPTMYDCRKFGHCLPDNNVFPCFPILHDMPSGIFRCTEGEMLGYCAGKCNAYKNPEYFSYHHMSFYDIHYHLKKLRLPVVKSGRKPN